MEKAGVIMNYLLQMDANRIGMHQMRLYLRLKRVDKSSQRKITDFLANKPNVYRAVRCREAFDLIISLSADSIRRLDDYKNEVYAALHDEFNETEEVLDLELMNYQRTYLTGNNEQRQTAVAMADEAIILDKDEKAVFEALRENGAMSIVEIARRTGSTPRVVSNRLRKLKLDGVIIGCRPILDRKKIGVLAYKVLINAYGTPRKSIRKIYDFCFKLPNVIQIKRLFGRWNFEINFETFEEQDFYNALETIKAEFADQITRIDTIRVEGDVSKK